MEKTQQRIFIDLNTAAEGRLNTRGYSPLTHFNPALHFI